mmetsp:Transcript_17422/g.54517  ORF Transcript_17422/g.54517 Transcript_17422/m.54517 type:complete len:388 (+) Transcript_17422:83-1246(+)
MAPTAAAAQRAALLVVAAASCLVSAGALRFNKRDVDKERTWDISLFDTEARTSGAPWSLYPAGQVPGHTQAHGPESYENDTVRVLCGNASIKIFADVSRPMLVPFQVLPSDRRYTKERADTAVIVMPGGCRKCLDWMVEGIDIALWLNEIGFSAFVLKYRVPDTSHHDADMDAQRAVSLLRHKAPDLGLNASRIGVIGFSAGGTLAQSITFRPNRLYSYVDEVDDVSFRPDFTMLVYSSAEYTPKSWTRPQPPPLFVVAAMDDPFFSAGPDLSFIRNFLPQLPSDPFEGPIPLKNAVELHVFPEGGHGYGRCTIIGGFSVLPQVCIWPELAKQFIEKQVLGIEPPVQQEIHRKLFELRNLTVNFKDPYSYPFHVPNVPKEISNPPPP